MVEKCKMKVVDMQMIGGSICYDMECLTHGEKIRVYRRKLRKCNCFFNESIKEEINKIDERQKNDALHEGGVQYGE